MLLSSSSLYRAAENYCADTHPETLPCPSSQLLHTSHPTHSPLATSRTTKPYRPAQSCRWKWSIAQSLYDISKRVICCRKTEIDLHSRSVKTCGRCSSTPAVPTAPNVIVPTEAFMVSRIVWHDADTGRGLEVVPAHRMKGGW